MTPRRPRASVAAAAVLLLAGGCATRPMPQPTAAPDFGRSLGQPFRDLSLIREVAPEVLVKAAAGPYDLSGVTNCAETAAEIARLDTALGPDLAPAKPGEAVSAEGLAAGLVAGAVGLPFRGIVRTVTGAETRDRALREAVLAGMVRRGFLKGRAGVMGCPLPPPPPPAPAATPRAPG